MKLASKSQARRAMLEAAGVPFELADSQTDEEALKQTYRHLPSIELAAALAKGKALGVTGGLVLGADQVLERDDGRILSKPASRREAMEQLLELSGRTHRLHSAAALVEDGEIVWSACESVAMTMRPLSRSFLETYLDSEYEAIRWSVGGYRIEGPGVQLFDRIEGSHFAILGLPLLPLLGELRQRGVVPP